MHRRPGNIPHPSRPRRFVRRATSVLLISLTIFVCTLSLAGPNGLLKLRSLEHEVLQLETKNRKLSAEIVDLNNRIYGVQKSDFILEKTAREELGFAKPGEVVYVFPEADVGKSAYDKKNVNKDLEDVNRTIAKGTVVEPAAAPFACEDSESSQPSPSCSGNVPSKSAPGNPPDRVAQKNTKK